MRHAILLLTTVGLMFLLAGSLVSDAASTQEQVPTQEEVHSALEQAVAAGAPGVSVEIRSPEGSEFLTAGNASLESERPLRPEDSFRIASVTKTFTAALVMDLVEEGRLSLDDTVESQVPGLLDKGDAITVRQLLGHTSGLPEYTRDEEFLEAFSSGESLSPRDIVGFVSSEPLAFEPGINYEYSDTDNIVLGLIVEEVTGNAYEQELHSRILEPLGLQTTLLPDGPQMPEPHVRGYQYDPEGEGVGNPEDVTEALDPAAAWASGALIATTGDVSRFFDGLLGGELVGEEELELMQETVAGESHPPGPGTNRASLGLFGYELPCGVVWGHTGEFPGYRAFGAASADGRASLAMVVNATEISERANEAVVRAQQLASCRALGLSATGGSTAPDGQLAETGGFSLGVIAAGAGALLIAGGLLLRRRLT